HQRARAHHLGAADALLLLHRRLELVNDRFELGEPFLAQQQVDEQRDRAQRLALQRRQQRLALVRQQHLRRHEQRSHPGAGPDHLPHRLHVLERARGLLAPLGDDEQRPRVAPRRARVFQSSTPTSSMNSPTSRRWEASSSFCRRIFSAPRTESWITCCLSSSFAFSRSRAISSSARAKRSDASLLACALISADTRWPSATASWIFCRAWASMLRSSCS